MKSTQIDANGDVRCPVCGARNSFTSKRTGKAKVIGVVTVGVGVLAMPKRLKCNGCGENLKRGGEPYGPPVQSPLSRRVDRILLPPDRDDAFLAEVAAIQSGLFKK
jgi:hypothetical protein